MTCALIADDEPLLRVELRTWLSKLWPQLRIVAEVADGRAAVASLAHEQPDIVFLDVSMPRLDGIAAARQMRELGFGGAIVFVTAYDQYAVRAFEQRAIDYLVKPIQEARLCETIARLQERQSAAAPGLPQAVSLWSLDDLRATMTESIEQALARVRNPTDDLLDWVRVSRGNQFRLVPIDEVACFRAVPGYTQVTTQVEEHLISDSLAALLPRLDARRFVQVHRSAIVNLHFIASIRRDRTGRLLIELKHGLGTVETSRARAELLRGL
jgi:DNA-binding LytR/AlgR family response regulator